jgi:hypothetical protein
MSGSAFKLRDDYQRFVSGSQYNENYVENYRPPIIGEHLLAPNRECRKSRHLREPSFISKSGLVIAPNIVAVQIAQPLFHRKKRWQKYCSPECAGPATRESKRKWWNENRARNGGLQ